jgi:hypothetical protein
MPSTDQTASAHRADIQRAIDLLDSTDPAQLTGLLSRTGLQPHLKADPAALRQMLADDLASAQDARLAGASRGARQILNAAAQPC